MKTTFPLLLCGLIVVAGPALAAAPDRPATGTVLLLVNNRTLEGDIEQVGDQYRVRHNFGMTWVPGDGVLRLCKDKEDALAFLRRRANLRDPDERLRLARWCHLRGLREQAIAEVKAAVELRPEHEESRRLLQYLKQATLQAPEAAAAAAPAQPRTDKPAVELNADAMSQFATRVQPILMNACARCHVASGAGSFRLQRTYAVGLANRRVLQQNLAEVLKQLNLRQPEYSPLLIKAVSAHGPTGEAPLRGRQAEAFKALDGWVRLTLANNPHLNERLPAAETARPFAEAAAVSRPVPVRDDRAVIPAPPALPAAARKAPETPPPPPEANAADDYDVTPFNRQMHPGRVPPP